MDWTTVAGILGSNFFIAVVSLATARWQIRSAKDQLDKQLKNERELAQKERNREIRSEPLLKLRGELALAATKTDTVLRINLVEDLTEPMKKLKRDLLEENVRYMLEGELKKTLYSLDESEIIDKVSSIMSSLLGEMPTKNEEVDSLLSGVEGKILEVQSLINKRLVEL